MPGPIVVLLVDQLKHLITLTELPTVRIQVMPLAAGRRDARRNRRRHVHR
jgi:hypothetical protein